MKKPRIIVNPADPVSLAKHYLRPMFSQWLEIVDYDPNHIRVEPGDLVMSLVTQSHNWYQPLLDRGARIVYDVTWEYATLNVFQEKFPGAFFATAKCFFWINEHFGNCLAGHHNYVPNFSEPCTHLALLPIRQTKPHRRQLLTALKPWLNNMIYSTVDQGRYLPNDVPESFGNFQRNFNPEWYQKTHFSIVSETTTYTKYLLHVTEKTFKPLAFFHPFIVYGQPGTLGYLHELGFETYPNLFDESYDNNLDQESRLAQVIKNIKNFKQDTYDAETQARMRHNNALFYNRYRVLDLMRKEIVEPLLEYAETR